MVTLGDKMGQKFCENSAFNFYCNYCDYGTCRKSSFDTHILSAKHLKVTKWDKMGQKSANSAAIINNNEKKLSFENEDKFICDCGKEYKHRQGLWRHKKNCNQNNNTNDNKNNIASNFTITPELIVELIRAQIKNSEDMKETMLTLVNNGINNHSNNTTNSNINSHNKSFNLQFFLNETCKNAMNIIDFANSIQPKLADLEKIGELGYVDGISKIIVDNLKLLDITERPVHCSDLKRDTLYIKDNDKWEKENENNEKMKKLINSVTNKNISLIPEWKQKYPECTNSSSTKSTKINKMIMEVMDTDNVKREKIIKKIAKEVPIEKE
jgi:hypothetical protein